MLSTTDLVSCAFGYLVGFTIWSTIPQLLKSWLDKPRQGGASLFLLGCWTVADICLLLGLTLVGGLLTQLLQVAAYLLGDSAMLIQALFYRGYLPCTTRRRERKAEEHGALRTLVTAPLNAPFPSTRPPSHPSSKRSSSTRHQISNTSPSSSSRRELELGRGPRRARTGRRSRKGYYELAPGKEHHHDPLQSHWDAEEEDGQPTPQPTAVKRFIASAFGAHGNVTQPLCLVIMSSIMLLVWLATSFLPRDSLPALGHAQPPTVEGKVENVIVLGGWLAGWGGAILNNIPRAYQLYLCLRTRSAEGIEAWLFVSLIGESASTLISVMSVSYSSSKYLYAEAPFIAMCIAALIFDSIFIILHIKYHGRTIPHSTAHPWRSASFLEHQALPPPSAPSAERDNLHRQALADRRKSFVAVTRAHTASFDPEDGDYRPRTRRSQAEVLDRRERELEAASAALDAHIELSGDEGRIEAHKKAQTSFKGRREAREPTQAASERRWGEWRASD